MVLWGDIHFYWSFATQNILKKAKMENLSATERLLPESEARPSSDSKDAFQPNLPLKSRRLLPIYLTFPILCVSLLLNTLFILSTLRGEDIDRVTIQHAQRYCKNQYYHPKNSTNIRC